MNTYRPVKVIESKLHMSATHRLMVGFIGLGLFNSNSPELCTVTVYGDKLGMAIFDVPIECVEVIND